VIADSAGGAWSFGSSILTFVFPMILFVVVACALYVAYTKPELVPGHRNPAAQRPVTYTAVAGPPPEGGPAQLNTAQLSTGPASTAPASTGPGDAGTATKPEGGE
jgi:hypothetical protein